MSASPVRLGPRLRADPRRVVAKLFVPGEEASDSESRVHLIVDRIRGLTEEQVTARLDAVLAGFDHRHRDFEATLERHAALVWPRLHETQQFSRQRRLLVGAYLTHEYSVESASLCNPSMVKHPDQSGVPVGRTRFLMSVRAIGEGHLSSVEFRTGVAWRGGITVDDPGAYLAMGARVGSAESSHYDLTFPPGTPVGQQLIWPNSAAESNGIEDVRLVRFVNDDGAVQYLGTYTAYDGDHVAPHVLTTSDFHTYHMGPLAGPAACNKGMAQFPRRVGGRYLALSRWDRENISLATSTDAQMWERGPILRSTIDSWEFIQVGNCGSPIETEDGWFVLTHGVGPMRTYCLGAILLDLDRPDRVLAETVSPLLEPGLAERDGYVPNVVYSCGPLLHDGTLTIPYGISDSSIGFAQIELAAALRAMRRTTP